MEKEEDMKTQNGGIVNYFQGATINNLVINGNMTKSGTENFYTAQSDSKMEDPEREVNINTVAQALDKCKSYLWGQAALATVFCVCRDVYHLGDNASWFERKMEQMEINCPPGTIANAMRNNPYMKKHIDNWENNGAQERVMVLMKEFKKSVEEVKSEETPTQHRHIFRHNDINTDISV